MVTLLVRWLIPNRNQLTDPHVRVSYGILCGAVGIFLNILLFIGKLFAGIISGSVAIMADAVNNLSDAGSSLITMIGFRLSGQKPDSGHPFGHGRIEYVAGLIVSLVIMLMGVELFKSSVEKIIAPADVSFSPIIAGILAVSILVKLYMLYYNRKIGKKIDSSAMCATAMDSFSDSLATIVVLISMILSVVFHIRIDGYCGILVSFFILYAGFKAAKDTINPLLGQPPAPEFVARIREIVSAHPEVMGMHDLVVHNYGPGRTMISLHAEVDVDANLLHAHDAIDNIERELSDELGCSAVIHMDPIATKDTGTLQLKMQIAEQIQKIDQHLTIHDFRMVPGPTHTNIIFDIVIPYHLDQTDDAIRAKVEQMIRSLNQNYRPVVTIDKSYVL